MNAIQKMLQQRKNGAKPEAKPEPPPPAPKAKAKKKPKPPREKKPKVVDLNLDGLLVPLHVLLGMELLEAEKIGHHYAACFKEIRGEKPPRIEITLREERILVRGYRVEDREVLKAAVEERMRRVVQ